MVIRGNIRGNGAQLAHYLLGEGGNERIQLLEVDGREDASEIYLHQTLSSMSVTAELTRTDKGLYHAQINPAYQEDRRMRPDDWQRAADILGHELGLSEQRRVIVLHTKKNRTHAHVVFERYDHQTGKVIDNRFSRLAQDRARKEMERMFEHAPTPHRNQHRPELKDQLTTLWQETQTGPEFIDAVQAGGYLLAQGVPRHPFMVVDENGRSFDLVRQLKGIRIKEVRQRLRDAKLIPEKEAIALMRERQEGHGDATSAQQPKADPTTDRTPTPEHVADGDDTLIRQSPTEPLVSRQKLMADFMQMGQEQTAEPIQNDSLEQKRRVARTFLAMGDELTNEIETSVADDHAPDHVDNKEVGQGMPDEAQRNESQQRPVAQLAINRKGISQSSLEPDSKHHQAILKDFIQAADDLAEQDERTEEATPRQQTIARQFFDNEALASSKDTDKGKERQRLMQQQKESRERSRHRARRRNR